VKIELLVDLFHSLAPVMSGVAVYFIQKMSGKLDKLDDSINEFSIAIEVSKIDRQKIWDRLEKLELDIDELKRILYDN
jgi:archaellum component FlaC